MIFKKGVAILVVMAMFFCITTTTNQTTKAKSSSVESFYEQLPEVEKQCYQDFKKQIKENPTRNTFKIHKYVDRTEKIHRKLIDLSDNFSQNVLSAYAAFSYDHPENYWLADVTYSWLVHTKKSCYDITVTVKLKNPVKHTKQKNKKFNNKLNKVVKKLKRKTANKSQRQKLKIINQWIVKNVKYNNSSKNSRNAYGALVNKKGVCVAISSLFKILCDKLGVKSMKLVGRTNKYGHAWNYVKVGKKWYGVDATWNITSKKKQKWLMKRKGFRKNHIFIYGWMLNYSVRKFKAPKL